MDFAIALVPDAQGYSVVIDGVTYRTLRRDASDNLLLAVASLPLPAGAATAAKQDTMITALQLIDDLRNALAAVATDQLRIDLINPFSSTSLGNGHKTVTTAGTQVQLSAQACKAVSLKALAANTGFIYVGDSNVDSSTGYELDAGDVLDLAVDNLNRIWLDASVSGEGISFLWVS